MGLKQFIATQLSHPSGLFGRLVMARLLDKGNARINQQTLDALDIAPGDRVLEVGFGGGGALALAARQVGAGQAVGVELSRDMVARGQKKFARLIRQNRVAIHQGDVFHLPFGDGVFDGVYTVNTLYFWPDPVRALREIRRVTPPNGRLVLAMRSRQVMERLDFPRDIFTFYTPEEAAQLVSEAGYQQVRVDHRDRDQKFDGVLVIGQA